MNLLSRTFLLHMGFLLGLTLACAGSAPNDDLALEPRSDDSAPVGQAAFVPSPPAGGGEGRDGLTWEAPKAWTSQSPSSKMRKAQYAVHGEAGKAELVVFYFGAGQGGNARANAERWAGQFTQPDGRSSQEVMKTNQTDINGIPVTLVEIKGTYQASPMMGGASDPKPGHMLLAAIAEGPDANWFFRLTGPEATVESNRAEFDSLIGSLRMGE